MRRALLAAAPRRRRRRYESLPPPCRAWTDRSQMLPATGLGRARLGAHRTPPAADTRCTDAAEVERWRQALTAARADAPFSSPKPIIARWPPSRADRGQQGQKMAGASRPASEASQGGRSAPKMTGRKPIKHCPADGGARESPRTIGL